ncbi:MAG: type IV pilus modification PilV family protein [Planctomycetota bacterium]|jgi:type II secretory pathway pseudopilin PulG
MGWIWKALKRNAADRAGMTVLEVLLSLAIFLIGAVSILSLFVAASVLHAEATNRRTASFIANELLAQVKSMRFREVYARATVVTDEYDGLGADDNVVADAVTADVLYQSANFNRYPRTDLFYPEQEEADAVRSMGPILIGSEWMWYTGLTGDVQFDILVPDRGLWGTSPSVHSAGNRILQPRTWHYVVDEEVHGREDDGLDGIIGNADDDLDGDGDPEEDWLEVTEASVKGDPTSQPSAPTQGYLVIDDEWVRYDGRDFDGATDLGTFTFSDFNNDGAPDRGWGGTEIRRHMPGTPVTVAREHPYYPGFYYTVQFYPVNTTGSESHVVVCVAYRTGTLFRVRTFRSLFAPTKF